MNFLGGGGGGGAPSQQDSTVMRQALVEMETMMTLFDNMSRSCFSKCVQKMNEPDLNIGEMSCIDRCVGKYMEAQQKVGEKLGSLEQAMQPPQ
mmetsp:Transcript_13688/g.27270  ORF Transcript_13688/g.27270 Transcript_13688/m.27270 type:complete len:93 (-) Transcript_13688:91-369(-)|eukprot:CAMPEP_0182457234 /NCGR_PEP_ID=MMETSP1319-20130603/2852_1 /TAXON_ID=172717 /ORGANISM="Bolidomonas pacifica, Strain RCC208" /LENGTH=92 /DNA_ID=CAMNT_0024655657 /DNA_START=54 /DNA_END=332 /DNA_ORIENTATION=-